jgi:AbiV family abortive infection protein
MTTVSPDALLRGAWFALEQCGLLIEDASILFERQRYATAVGLALLAREELGRHQILFEFWHAASSGHPPTVDTVQKASIDHTTKQRRGRLSLTFTATDSESQLGRLLATAPPDNPQFVALQEQMWRRQPDARRVMRERAFYVDLTDAEQWTRPSQLSPTTCANELRDAVGDYLGARDRMLNGHLLVPDDPMKVALGYALEAWTDKPELPVVNKGIYFGIEQRKADD